MLLGLTLISVVLSVYIFQSPGARWRMFAFFRKSPRDSEQREGQRDKSPNSEKVQKQSNSSPEQDRQTVRPIPPNSGDLSPDGTPKAQPVPKRNLPPVPLFSLIPVDDNDSGDDSDHAPPASFPSTNSAQRASAPSTSRKPPTLKPLSNSVSQAPPSQLMPPPPRLPPPSRPIPSLAAGLRVPPAGPLPNRGPPTANSLAVPPSIAVKTPNPRQKVLLKPGHSPLDWANLQKSSNNLSGVDRLVRVTPSLLKHNNGRKGRPAWSVYQGKVYNISPYLPYHPGGEGELRRAAGKDGEKLFMEVHPWVNWENMLGECLVGIMVAESDGVSNGMQSKLDEMD